MLGNERGIALILTLWILAALIVLALGLGMLARTETQIARNYSDLIKCRWAARAGADIGMVEVGKLLQQPIVYFDEGVLRLTSEELRIDLEGVTFEIEIEDEAGKVNVNSASPEMMELIFDSREAAECIVDWRDEDDTSLQLGAETEYYSALRSPYRAKNAPLDTVGELMLIKGITGEMMSTRVTAEGGRLSSLLTVYSHDRNQDVQGQRRVNIMTADKDALKNAVGDVVSDQQIDAFISWRDGGSTNSGPSTPTTGPRTRNSLSSAGEIARAPGVGRDIAMRIYDRITVKDDEVLYGLININTASPEVLSTVPGLQDAAESVVAYRMANGPFSDVGQLLAVDAVTTEAFAMSADLLTVRSRVFKITSTGRLARGRSSQVITCVIDLSDGEAVRTKYWQE